MGSEFAVSGWVVEEWYIWTLNGRDKLDVAKDLQCLKSLTDKNLKQTFLNVPQEETILDDEKRLLFESIQISRRANVFGTGVAAMSCGRQKESI